MPNKFLPNDLMQKAAYSVKEACLLYGFSSSWLYAEWAAGRGPVYFKLGKRRLIRKADLEAWIKLKLRDPADLAEAAERLSEAPKAVPNLKRERLSDLWPEKYGSKSGTGSSTVVTLNPHRRKRPA